MVLGVALVAAVYVLDRAWIEGIDLQLPRVLAVAVVIAVSTAGALLLSQLEPNRLQTLVPYAMTVALAVVYLLDCLTLEQRFHLLRD